MNPYEVSQASSDAIQSLIDTAHKLEEGTVLLSPIVDRLHQRVLRLQQLHSRSWHLLRHNNEHAHFLMARLESMDVLCGRLLPAMTTARAMFTKSSAAAAATTATSRFNRWSSSGYEFLSPSARASCCYPFTRDRLGEVLESVSDELERWLDLQEEVLEQLSCQAYGVSPRMQSHCLEGYQRIPKIMRGIGESLIFTQQKVVILHGPPGVGKSSVAAFVAANPPECFSDGAVEVRLGRITREEELVARLRHLLQDLNCRGESAATAADCWSLVEEAVRESNHLIVVDDVCDTAILERLVGMRNGDHGCKFLVTCQDDPVSQLDCSGDDSICSIKLGFRDTAAVSAEILKFHTGMKNLPAAAAKLLRYCSHHPLSVSILGEALRGSWKTQEWKSVLNHFEVCSSGPQPGKPRKKKSSSVKPMNWMAGVVASIEMGRVGMQQETQQLFDSFSVLSWSGPVPVECLKALWTAVGNKSPFLVHARDLVRRCLLKRKPDFTFYEMHELVGVYLERKLNAALDQLLNLSQPGVRAVIAPWLLHFGNTPAKQAAAKTLRGLLVLDNEELHAKALISIVEVFKACSRCSLSRDEICKQVNSIVGEEIVNLLFRASSPWVSAAITKYISACFSDVDYEVYGRGLVASGLVEKLRSLLTISSSSGVNTLVKKDVADVLSKLAGNCSGDRYVVDSLIRSSLIPELVKLVDSRSGWIHEGAMNAVVKLTNMGDEDGAAVEQMLQTDMVEKLVVLLQSRKQSAKRGALETIGTLVRVRSGGWKVVERLVHAGVLEELETQLGCSGGHEDVQAGCCSVCLDLFVVAGEGSLERVVRSRVVEGLTGLLMGDGEVELVRSRAVAALQALVKVRGKAVVERIVRAAGVDSIVKGLENPPDDAAFTGAYRKLLKSIVD